MSEQFEPHPGGGYYANTDFMPVDSWRILRIMSEFVESFETMSRMPDNLVAVFGSARTPEDSPDYQAARQTGAMLVKAGYGVITGGGPGIMGAANRGAKEAGGRAIGLNIELPMEQHPNEYQTDSPLRFRSLTTTGSAACADSISSVIFIYGSSIPLSAALSFSLARWMSLRKC